MLGRVDGGRGEDGARDEARPPDLPGLPGLPGLVRRLAAGRAVVAGVLSGTSADGIDVALARLPGAALRADGAGDAPPQVLAFATLGFDEALAADASRGAAPGGIAPAAGLAARVRAVLDGREVSLRELALLHRDLGRAFGAAARLVARDAGLPLDLVGSHGQTVWHHDGREPSGPATLQLGDGDWAAHAAGAWVASDFRQADVAAGGEGAPISALADAALFPRLPRPAAVLNLGGIANLSVLRAGEEVAAFDVGPANALLDGLARRLLGRAFDEDGRAAAAGAADEGLLARLSAHPFFAQAPPKSTGRDTFGEAWLDALLASAPRLAAEDWLATAVELVARSVADALERWTGPVGELVLAGGGARNGALVRALARRLPVPVRSSAAHGVDPDAREALVFAVLGARTALGVASSSPAATGARRGAVLGKLSAPFRGAEAAGWTVDRAPRGG